MLLTPAVLRCSRGLLGNNEISTTIMNPDYISESESETESTIGGVPNPVLARSYGSETEGRLNMLRSDLQEMRRVFHGMRSAIGEFILPIKIRERLRRKIFGETLKIDDEELGSELVESLDQSFVDDHSLVSADVRLRFHFVSDLVSECKASLPGITEESKSNRLVAERWLGNKMRERNMRTRHIKCMLPIALESVFIPDQYQIEARKLRQSRAVQERINQGKVKYYSRSKPWLGNWFGTRSRRADPVDS